MPGVVDSGLPADIAQQATKELLRACLTGGIPFSLVDNPHFRRFVGLLQPDYVLPSAHSVHTAFPDSSPASLRKAEKLTYNCGVQLGRSLRR